MNKVLGIVAALAMICAISCSKVHDRQSDQKQPFDRPFPLLSGPGPMGMPSFNSPTPAEMDKLREEVGFDKQTGARILEIIRSFNTLMKSNIVQIQKEELNVRGELLKDKPDLQYIQKCVQEKTRIFGEIEFNQIKRDLDIKALLTADQYETWISAVSRKRHDRMRDMRDPQMPPQADRMAPEGPAPRPENAQPEGN
jgi:hypothetical protein